MTLRSFRRYAARWKSRTGLDVAGRAGLVIGIAALLLGYRFIANGHATRPPGDRRSYSEAAMGQLTLKTQAQRHVGPGGLFRLDAQVKNLGPHPVTVFEPGEGSFNQDGVTPDITFEVERLVNKEWHPQNQLESFSECGNRSPPRLEAVHNLKSGETMDLIAALSLRRAGEYRIRMTYANDPLCRRLDWGEDFPGVMLIRTSTRCRVTSDYFFVTKLSRPSPTKVAAPVPWSVLGLGTPVVSFD